MKKIAFLIPSILLLVSCNKSLYYAYYSDGKYATVEIQDNNIAIYRSNSNNYIYTESAAIFTTTDTIDYVEFSLPYSLYYIEENRKKFDLCGFEFKTPEDKFRLVSYKKINEDSIVSIGKSDRNQFLENGSCFTENNINWLPPYLKRVNKVDYKKFNLPEVKDKYLKNPIKAPKVFD